jgi:pyruvate formate lyase activating enzyme
VEHCPGQAREIIGYRVNVETVVAEVEKDRLFYDESGGGVTFSGGEPLMQAEFLLACVRACRARDIHVTVDTTCHADRDTLLEVADAANLLLCDIKHTDPAKHRQFTGVEKDPIFANIRALATESTPLVIRLPMIGGYNDDLDQIRQVADFIVSLKTVHRVDLLPYNPGGFVKATRLADPIPVVKAHRVPAERMVEIVRIFQEQGCIVKIEG